MRNSAGSLGRGTSAFKGSALEGLRLRYSIAAGSKAATALAIPPMTAPAPTLSVKTFQVTRPQNPAHRVEATAANPTNFARIEST